MKHRDLIRHLEVNDCFLRREGGNHSIYKNSLNGKMTAVPRHREVKVSIVRKTRDDLGIKRPRRVGK